MGTVEVARSFSNMPKRKQVEEEARERYEQSIDNKELRAFSCEMNLQCS